MNLSKVREALINSDEPGRGFLKFFLFFRCHRQTDVLIQTDSATVPGLSCYGIARSRCVSFRASSVQHLISGNGNEGTFYLHPNRKGAEALGKFWGEGIYEALFIK